MCHQWVTPFIRQVPKAGHYPPGAVLVLKGERSGGGRGKFQELSCFIRKLFLNSFGVGSKRCHYRVIYLRLVSYL